MFFRAALGMTYWGLSLNTSNLGIDHYGAFALAGGIDTVAFVMVVLLVERAGRRWMLSLCCLVGGVALLLTHAAPHGRNLKFQLSSPFLSNLALFVTSQETRKSGKTITILIMYIYIQSFAEPQLSYSK